MSEIQTQDRISVLEQMLGALYESADEGQRGVIEAAWQEIGAMQGQLDQWAEMAVRAKRAAEEYQAKLVEAIEAKHKLEADLIEIEEINPDHPLVAAIIELVEEDTEIYYGSMFVSEDPAQDIREATGADYMSAETFFEIIFGWGLSKPSDRIKAMAREAIETIAREHSEECGA